ncbi:hypothetical protein WICMUC_002203 [Wickerhamomyces mucosus]|uniref:phosphatidylinositol-3,4,5-trisphosphate 3-phosphatase n=1 Tax=Wickerhamomyces mucosus TaxID=1378264 RepID=A0A9P8PQ70_9ASCO|nr:hypothetical protein WICMUC_002203 [Wickerhamomyces mucosus]
MLNLRELTAFATKSNHDEKLYTLDISCITDRLIVCSYPTSKWPKSIFRNGFKELQDYLDDTFDNNWKIFNLRENDFKGEYDVRTLSLQSKIEIHPLRDHNSPSFQMILDILKRISSHLNKNKKNIAVIHCKLGKGRSGLVTIGFLIIHHGYPSYLARELFTKQRMRPGFGEGVCIKSQIRYIEYCDLYAGIKEYTPFKVFLHSIKFFNTIPDFIDTVEIQLQCLDHHNNLKPIDLVKKSDSPSVYELTNKYKKMFEVDYRLSLAKKFIANLPISFASIGFNLYWESKRSEESNLLKFLWDDLDGIKGSSKKGLKLFDYVEFTYSLSDTL